MTHEISRKTWRQFCRKFSAENQFRTTSCSVSRPGNPTENHPDKPLIGLALSKSGRFIDGVRIFTSNDNPEKLNQPQVSVVKPVELILSQNADGTTRQLAITAEDGTLTELSFDRSAEPIQREELIEKMAYHLSQNREPSPGGDIEDWHEAEKTLNEACLIVTKG